MPNEYSPSERIRNQIEVVFTYHAPKEDQQPRYARIRDAAKLLANEIAKATPESREQSLALTHLEEVVMFANAAIARNEV